MGNFDRNFKNMLTSNLGLDTMLSTDTSQTAALPAQSVESNKDADTASLIGTGKLAEQDSASVQQ